MTCKNCGSYVDNNAKFCNVCGTSTEAPKKKKKKKAPKIIAILLALALIAGGVFFAYKNTPTVKVYDALKNTLFNSSEYDITVKITDNDDEDVYSQFNIKLTLGDDVDSSVCDITITEQYYDYIYFYGDDYYYDDYTSEPTLEKYTDNISIKDGKVYLNDEFQGNMDELFDGIEHDLSYYTDEKIDVAEEIDNLINGKIDEASLEKLYNATIAPILEEIIKESSGESVELPEYKDIMGTTGTLSDLIKRNKDVKNALALKKIDSDQPGTTYEYSIDMGALAQAVLDYAMEDDQYMAYLEAVVDYSDYYDDVDDLVKALVEDFEDYENLEGTITVKSNRITHFTLENEDSTIEITIDSKK